MDVILELLNHIESERLIILILWFLLLWRIWKLDGLKPYLSIKRVRILLSAAAGIATVMLAACLFFVYIPTEPFFENQSKYLFLAGILLFGSAALAVLAVIYNIWLSSMRRQIKEVKRQSEEDIIRAYALLKKMDPDQMVPSIKKEFVRECFYLLTRLGDFGKAERFLEEMGEQDTPLSHLFQGLKQMEAGDLTLALQEMRLAEECIRSERDWELKIQIFVNHGVIKVCQGFYEEADYYFEAARKLVLMHPETDGKIRNIVYYNYTFNCYRLSKEESAWRAPLEEYRRNLDSNDLEASLSASNLELEMMRQSEADPREIEKKVQEELKRERSIELSEEQRCSYIVSTARIIWSGRMNPEFCLKRMDEVKGQLPKLAMPGRYKAMKEIDLFFRDLRSDRLLETYRELDSMAETYMRTQAASDLRSYMNSLPEEAVCERGFIRMELAALKKLDPDNYKFSEVRQLLEDAASLYEENHLIMKMLDVRLAIMDECTYIMNLTEHHKPIDREEMLKQMEIVEEWLPRIQNHPQSAEFALRLSYYCYHLDEYEKCVTFYGRFQSSGLALAHFAPWLREYARGCGEIVRVLRFADRIRRIREDKGKLSVYSEEIQEWFRDFPQSDGFHAALLLGRFLGNGEELLLKYRIWYDEAGTNRKEEFLAETEPHGLHAHVWLCNQAIGLEIDLTYEQFHPDRDAGCILFSMDHHPFETETSYFIQKNGRETGMRFQTGVLERSCCLESMRLPQETKVLLDTVYKLLCEIV